MDVRIAGGAHDVGPEAGAPVRVLVLDDDRGVRETLAMLVRDLGHPCVTASSSREARDEQARALAEGSPFGCAFVDVHLPEAATGFDVARELLARDTSLSVFLMSGDPDAVPPTPGIAGVLPKPFTEDQLAFALASTK